MNLATLSLFLLFFLLFHLFDRGIVDLLFDLIDQFFKAGVHLVDVVLLADGVLLAYVVNVLPE